MSMSTHIVGFRPPDEKWRQMKAVWDATKAAGLDPPEQVLDFFEGVEPDPAGVEVPLLTREWSDDSREGCEINVADLPAGVRTIRFYHSY